MIGVVRDDFDCAVGVFWASLDIAFAVFERDYGDVATSDDVGAGEG